uniref:Chemokine interleukin-8-like domain-containing protein n=1 Tax=Paramormyrops kingsleyae TaxID=1676925 RepID=A0A3B3Q541_9TELE
MVQIVSHCIVLHLFYRRPSKVSTTCCKMVSSAPILFDIYGYERQNALGPCVEAIVFDTVKGKVCSNPKARWVIKKMKGNQPINGLFNQPAHPTVSPTDTAQQEKAMSPAAVEISS